ncbi:MAG: site-specific DNA-methyltransferase [Deltaproteobacteria bacterium]|nr:site-specific DNA-methyltransferase [Deltaproteobacteria bacterium]
MPTLNWIGKAAVVNHHLQVPFHLLKDVPSLACGEPGNGNLIVQGDNLVALKALLPYYAGQVKCICIDPPYNTGNENWVYNDNVNSPIIRDWLGKVVGSEGETLDRHDRWLCLMYPRLALLRKFLRSDGAIFVCIDDVEVAYLRLLMDELFGAHNFIGNFVWQSKDTPGNNSSGVAETHNHIIAYRRSDAFQPNLLARNEKQVGTYTNPDNDPRGPWLAAPLTRVEHRDRDYYAIKNPVGKEILPPKGSSWRRPPAKMKQLASDNRVWWGKSGDSEFPMEKKFLSEAKEGVVNQTWWPYDFAGSTRNASAEMKDLFAGAKPFDTPKPAQLFKVIISLSCDSNDLVLDSFAGSGTTGHAVLSLNKQDGGNRRFILVEMEANIAREITAERVRRVAEGYKNAKGEKVEGLGGGFRYCELGDPLFYKDGKIREYVSFDDLARHVYFTETGEPLPREKQTTSPFLGECRGVGIYLLYNGILGDKTANGGNVLTRAVLARLPKYDGQKVIYCAGCLLGRDRLQAERIIVRQTPYEIKIS